MRPQMTDEKSSDRSRHGAAVVALAATFVAAGWAAYRTLTEADEPAENHAWR